VGTSPARGNILPIGVLWKDQARHPFFGPHPYSGHRARVLVLRQRLLLLEAGSLISTALGSVVVFGHYMGKDEAEAQEHHCDSYQMAELALWRRLLTLCHRHLLSA
jgi:hypothetical protein